MQQNTHIRRRRSHGIELHGIELAQDSPSPLFIGLAVVVGPKNTGVVVGPNNTGVVVEPKNPRVSSWQILHPF